jgi:hypothetical protein
MQTPSLDALNDKLALTVLSGAARVAAVAGVAQAEKVITSAPQTVAAILSVLQISAGKTLDLRIQGRRLSTDAWTDLQVIPQKLTGDTGSVVRYNLPSLPRYRVFETTAGTAFNGTTDLVAYDLVLVGTDCYQAQNGIAQV